MHHVQSGWSGVLNINAMAGKDATKNAKAMKRVRDACQEAKHALSTSDSTFIEVRSWDEALSSNGMLTRARSRRSLMGKILRWS